MLTKNSTLGTKLSVLVLLGLFCVCRAQTPSETVPGVVIHHSPASSGLYIGSPSLAILTNGDYLACHDYFGPKSAEHECPTVQLFRSTDRGASWAPAAQMKCLFWHALFVHRGNVYLMGTDKHHGHIVIRRSTDQGKTWSEPRDTSSGLLTPEGQYHTAPMPIVEHDGRLWRAFEDASRGTEWGKRYSAGMLSIPVDADLLKAENWAFSNFLPRDGEWLDGKFQAWLEGNAVVTPEGRVVDILRVQTPNYPERAAMVFISKDGKTASFDPATGFFPFPGGGKKFVIRWDAKSKVYWALASPVLEQFKAAGVPGSVRNTLALLRSTNLREWETRCILLHHPDTVKHGFQYPDWHFDGEDIAAVVRVAYDDNEGGAHNHHDANYLTFNRIRNFRTLTMKDSVPVSTPKGAMRKETSHFVVSGLGFDLAVFESGAKAFANRDYVWLEVPPQYRGLQFTRLSGGERAQLAVQAKADTRLFLATSSKSSALLDGWTAVGDAVGYSDREKSRLAIYRREIKAGEELVIPQGGWAGNMLLLPGQSGSQP